MIHHFLQIILNSLQAELKEQVPKAKKHWRFSPVANPSSIPLPLVTVSSAELEGYQMQPSQPHASKKAKQNLATTAQEFAQFFSIDVYAKAPDELEAIASLTLATVLTSQASLINAFNQSTATAYKGQTVRTRHHLRQLKFLSATPAYYESSVAMTLSFTVTGYLTLEQFVEDSGLTIKTVTGLKEEEIELLGSSIN